MPLNTDQGHQNKYQRRRNFSHFEAARLREILLRKSTNLKIFFIHSQRIVDGTVSVARLQAFVIAFT